MIETFATKDASLDEDKQLVKLTRYTTSYLEQARLNQLARKQKWRKDVYRKGSGRISFFATRICQTAGQREIWLFDGQNRQPKMVKTKIQNIIIYTRPSSAI